MFQVKKPRREQKHTLSGEVKINLELGNITRNKYTSEVKKLGEIPEAMEEYIEDYKDFVIEQYNSKKLK